MAAPDALLTLAEIALGLAGFTGVIVPEGMLATGLAPTTTWRAGSMLLLGYLVVAGRSALVGTRALEPEQRAYLDARYLRAVPVLLGGVGLMLAGNVLGVWWSPGYPAFYFGVLSLLAFAAFQFVRIVFVRPGGRP